jgi:uncharacterized membrane protein YfcA
MELSILVFVLVGFIAQMIDGALGMAYGVQTPSCLVSASPLPRHLPVSTWRKW